MARVPTFALYTGMGLVFLGLYLAGSSRAPAAPPSGPAPPPPPPTPQPGTPRVPQRGAFHFSPASLSNMRGVHPELVAVATRALELGPLDFAVTSGGPASGRTVEEQQRLFDEGFSDCNPSAGCVGKHTTNRALDLAPIFDGRVELNSRERVRQLAPQVRAASAELGVPVKWLGDSTQFVDPFHWELLPSTGAPNVNGYRRALQAEVTPYITAQAQAALAHSLGEVRGPFVDEHGRLFKVRLEVHSNAPKGASVFLRDEAPTA